MKTSYEILWIDDNLLYIDEHEKEINEFLEEYGIKPETEKMSKFDDELKSVDERINSRDLDIIIIDYNMPNMNGDKLIEGIRKNNHYLPIIFYSGNFDVTELFKAVSDAQLDGVYIANRDTLVAKSKQVIKSLIKKEQSTKRTRGLLLEGVSEIDARLSKLIVSSWNKINEDQQDRIFKYFQKEIVKERVKDASKRAAKFPKTCEAFQLHINENISTNAYSVHNRWRLALKLLEMLDIKKESRQVLRKFVVSCNQEESLNELRNEYAHKTRNALESEHNTDRCIKIRRKLRKQLTNIEELLSGSEE